MEDEKKNQESERTVTLEEVLQAYETLKATNFSTRFVIGGYRYKSWEILFSYYSSSTGEKLKVGCYPCFGRVKAFVEQKFFLEEYEKNRSAGTSNK